MRIRLRVAIFTLLTCSLFPAAGTKFVSVYRNPAAGPSDLSGKRVAAFVTLPAEEDRWGREETMAAVMRRRGVDCVAGHTVLPEELVNDREKAREFLRKAGIQGVILMRLVGDEEKTVTSHTTAPRNDPSYYNFWGSWRHGWSTVYLPEYSWKERVITLETAIYSTDTDELLWAGRSGTARPKDITKFVKDLAEAAGKELRKTGLVNK